MCVEAWKDCVADRRIERGWNEDGMGMKWGWVLSSRLGKTQARDASLAGLVRLGSAGAEAGKAWLGCGQGWRARQGRGTSWAGHRAGAGPGKARLGLAWLGWADRHRLVRGFGFGFGRGFDFGLEFGFGSGSGSSCGSVSVSVSGSGSGSGSGRLQSRWQLHLRGAEGGVVEGADDLDPSSPSSRTAEQLSRATTVTCRRTIVRQWRIGK